MTMYKYIIMMTKQPELIDKIFDIMDLDKLHLKSNRSRHSGKTTQHNIFLIVKFINDKDMKLIYRKPTESDSVTNGNVFIWHYTQDFTLKNHREVIRVLSILQIPIRVISNTIMHKG